MSFGIIDLTGLHRLRGLNSDPIIQEGKKAAHSRSAKEASAIKNWIEELQYFLFKRLEGLSLKPSLQKCIS